MAGCHWWELYTGLVPGKDTIDFWQAGKEQEFLSHRTESAVVSSVRKTQTLVKAEGEKVTEIKGQWQGGHKQTRTKP